MEMCFDSVHSSLQNYRSRTHWLMRPERARGRDEARCSELLSDVLVPIKLWMQVWILNPINIPFFNLTKSKITNYIIANVESFKYPHLNSATAFSN